MYTYWPRSIIERGNWFVKFLISYWLLQDSLIDLNEIIQVVIQMTIYVLLFEQIPINLIGCKISIYSNISLNLFSLIKHIKTLSSEDSFISKSYLQNDLIMIDLSIWSPFDPNVP